MHGRHPVLRPVWVQLDTLYVSPTDGPRRVTPHGLDMSGQVPGLLSGWFEDGHGRWYGVTNFQIPYVDGRQAKLQLHDQLVPARALRPREPSTKESPAPRV